MENPDFWTRLKEARIVQVLLVYLGASWGILQVVDVLQNTLVLPEWLGPVAVVLLLIGLVVILATAWVQSLPRTTERELKGEVPTDWEVAPKELVGKLMSGRIPHLTWGRSILGGVFALAVIFGVAGVAVILRGPVSPFGSSIGPAEAGADMAATGIAVVPFDVRGEDLEIWREGMMDLLSNNLDGVGGYRTIDARTVMSRWRSIVGDDTSPDLEAALRAAGATGARYALSGSVVGLGENVRLVANIYDLDTGEEVAQGRAEGAAEDVLTLADDLAVETMRALLSATGREGGDITAETMTTRSLPALRAFLEGESHYRRGEFAEAVQEYERAVAADSAFAIALIRLSEGYGWLESVNSELMVEMGERAMAHADRLSPRYQFVMEAWNALNHGNASGVAVLLEAVQKYPDDPEAWFLLAETYIHIEDATYSDSDGIMNALERAVALDPDFAPYLIHVIEEHVIRGELDEAEETLTRYKSLTGDDRGVEHVAYAIPIFYGDSVEAVEAGERLRRNAPQVAPILNGTFGTKMDQFDRTSLIYPAVEAALGSNEDPFRAFLAGSQGALRRGSRYLDSLSLTPSIQALYLAHVSALWDVTPVGKEADLLSPASCEDPFFSGNCHLFVGQVSAKRGKWDDMAASIQHIEARRQAILAEDPEANVDFFKNSVEYLKAYEKLQRGNLREARQELLPLRILSNNVGILARLALGDLEAKQGRTEEAIRHFRASQRGFQKPLALMQLARLSETAGREDEALRYWERFLVLTRGGDQDLPQVVEAKEAVRRLSQ